MQQELKDKSISICGMRINMIQIPEVVQTMEDWIIHKRLGNYIVVSNAYDVVIGRNSIEVKKAANNSSFSVPDGISMVILSRLYGHKLKRRVYGPDLMLEFFKVAEKRGYTNFFYGSTLQTLEALVNNLKKRFPSLSVVGIYAPPFRNNIEIDEKEIEIINNASPDVLWVGLGCPKQQLWMYKHKDKLKVPVMVGVGAAFDFLAGTKPQAPRWIRDNGFEWLFRLISEPKRLWRRYLINGPIFLYFACKQIFFDILLNKKKNLSNV